MGFVGLARDAHDGFRVLRPQDQLAVKLQASPKFHAIQYLLRKQTQDKLAKDGSNSRALSTSSIDANAIIVGAQAINTGRAPVRLSGRSDKFDWHLD